MSGQDHWPALLQSLVYKPAVVNAQKLAEMREYHHKCRHVITPEQLKQRRTVELEAREKESEIDDSARRADRLDKQLE